MFGIEAISSYILVVALLTLLAAVLIWQPHRTGKTISVWLAAGVVGVLLGAAGAFALSHLMGYKLVQSAVAAQAPGGGSGDSAAGGGPPGGGGPPAKGGPPGMGGAVGGMGAKPGTPQPKRELTTLVRKLEVLTGPIAISLSSAEQGKLAACLAEIEKLDQMTDGDAEARCKAILAVLSEQQKSALERIGLPRPAGGGMGAGGKKPAAKPAADANPFRQETDAKALDSLRARLGSKGDAGTSPPKKP